MAPSRTLLLLAAFTTLTLAAPVKHTPPADNLSLPVTAHQQWVQNLGRLGCQYANKVRAQYGRRQLYYSHSLTNIGARHSSWMAYTNIFRHQSLRGLGAWVGRHWLPVTAENIAMSVPRSRNPAYDAHQQWYHSPGHFRNMISSRHTHCGVGIAYDRSGRWWGTQLFGSNRHLGNEGGSAASTAPPAAAAARASPGSMPSRNPAPAPANRATPAPRPRPSSNNNDQDSRIGEPLSLDGVDPASDRISPPSLSM